jgi:small subunit ribosomal protein S16
MVVIRLSRVGTNKRPFYHVVVADQRFSRNGRYLERVGYYNPIANGPEIYLKIETERLQDWLTKGAQPTERVRGLIKEFGKLGEINGTEYKVKTAAHDAKKAKRKAAKKAVKAEPAAAEAAPAAPAEEAK